MNNFSKLTLLATLLGIAFQTAAEGATPENFIFEFQDRYLEQGPIALIDYMHPAELSKMRTEAFELVEDALSMGEAGEAFAAKMFGPNPNIDDIAALSDYSFLAAFLKPAITLHFKYELYEVEINSEILDEKVESEICRLLVLSTATFRGKSKSKVHEVILRKYNGDWRLAMPLEIDELFEVKSD